MATEIDRHDELSREISKIIEGNRKFLARIMDDQFEQETAEREEAGTKVSQKGSYPAL